MNELLGQLRDPMLRDYTKWLNKKMGRGMRYSKMFDLLNSLPFYWDPKIPMDANRSGDGLYLRLEFMDKVGVDVDIEKYVATRECSILEMLIAAAKRMDSEYLQVRSKYPGDVIFWELIDNLDLSDASNDRFDKRRVLQVTDHWLRRKFTRNGIGSPFPVHRAEEDFRRIEYWSMMQYYIQERMRR